MPRGRNGDEINLSSGPGDGKAVSQLLWPDKDREEWFSLGENHEKVLGFPGFPVARYWPRAVMCGFLHGKPHAFLWPTKLHRKSGFGLHQLRNCCRVLLPALI